MSFFSRLGLGTPAAPPTALAASVPPVPGGVPVPVLPTAPAASTTPTNPRPAAPPPTDPASLLVERNNLIAALSTAQTTHAQTLEHLAQANASVSTLTGQLGTANASIVSLTTERDAALVSASLTVEQVRNRELATLAASQGIPPTAVPPVDPSAPAAADGSAFQDGYKAAAAKDPLAAASFILDTLKLKF